MANIKTLSDFHAYFSGVMERANCHALQVNEVLPLLAGVVLNHVDMKSGLQARTYRGDYANIAWVVHNGNRYAFTYDHESEQIILRANTLRGIELTRFDNSDTFSSTTSKIEAKIV